MQGAASGKEKGAGQAPFLMVMRGYVNWQLRVTISWPHTRS